MKNSVKLHQQSMLDLTTAHYMDSFKHNMELVGEIFGKEDEMKAELAEIDEQIAAINEKTC